MQEVSKKLKLIRKVKYINGQKCYLVYKLIDVQTYKHAHGQDIRRKSVYEN